MAKNNDGDDGSVIIIISSVTSSPADSSVTIHPKSIHQRHAISALESALEKIKSASCWPME